ncbi:hypothetical protein B7494_g2174 [Chlorociboria aeruginascens]|nr:hypothetical protein B7494_g2174 [Chlorociboria aeruginascens]
MIPSSPSTEEAIHLRLDNEITALQSRIKFLQTERNLQTSTILSSHTSASILSILRSTATNRPPPKPKSKSKTKPPEAHDAISDNNPLIIQTEEQSLHNITNLYRTCATITPFNVNDPDPNAVSSGKVFALRIDVCSGGKYVLPYYVFLNQPYVDSDAWRVHRHTIPVYMHLDNISARYLPAPKSAEKSAKQDMNRFARAVRNEIVGYHIRVSVIKSLRKVFGLDERGRKGKGKEKVIVDVSAVDAEAKQVRIEWRDGRIGRCVVGDKGEVRKCVVIGEEGRDRDVERRVLGGDGRMEGLGMRLLEGIY